MPNSCLLSKLQATVHRNMARPSRTEKYVACEPDLASVLTGGGVCVTVMQGLKGEHKKIQVVSKLIHPVSKAIHLSQVTSITRKRLRLDVGAHCISLITRSRRVHVAELQPR